MGEKIHSMRIEVRSDGDQLCARIDTGGGNSVLLGSIGKPLLDGNEQLLKDWQALITKGFGAFVERHTDAEVVAIHVLQPGEKPE